MVRDANRPTGIKSDVTTADFEMIYLEDYPRSSSSAFCLVSSMAALPDIAICISEARYSIPTPAR